MTELKTPTTAAGNKTLAEFMGKKPKDPILMSRGEGIATPNFEDIEKYEKMGYVANLTYHSDWNSLMPVWFKFRDLYEDMPYEHDDKYSIFSNEIQAAILRSKDGTPKEAFESLVLAISWYNTIKGK